MVALGAVDAVMLAPVGEAWVRAALPERLAEHVTVHVVEPSGGAGATVDLAAGEIAAAIERVAPGRRAIVFGHSMNGTLSLAAAAKHPELVAGVIAVGSGPSLPPDAEATKAHWDANAEPARKARFDEHASAYAAAVAGSPEQMHHWRMADRLRRWHELDPDEARMAQLDAAEGAIDMAWVQAVFADASNVDWPSVLASVRCPVLVALGRSDFLVPCDSWEGATAPPDLTVRVFERSSHTAFVEEPDGFVDAVAGWLRAAAIETEKT
ncbi:MAG TPA: alpha/beta hydrolase [Acidimicrobiales bacterium]